MGVYTNGQMLETGKTSEFPSSEMTKGASNVLIL